MARLCSRKRRDCVVKKRTVFCLCVLKVNATYSIYPCTTIHAASPAMTALLNQANSDRTTGGRRDQVEPLKLCRAIVCSDPISSCLLLICLRSRAQVSGIIDRQHLTEVSDLSRRDGEVQCQTTGSTIVALVIEYCSKDVYLSTSFNERSLCSSG